MSSNTKQERVWNDPPGIEAELPASLDATDKNTPGAKHDNPGRRWRIMFIGGLYILTGVILYAVINYSDIPVTYIPSIFLCVGGFFLLFGSLLTWIWRKNK